MLRFDEAAQSDENACKELAAAQETKEGGRHEQIKRELNLTNSYPR
jgi:hypothetical protein